jgi:hypothetical protein
MEVSFSKETGWLKTRASGILALLLAENPEMTWPDIFAWAHANGLDDWDINLSPSDYSAFVGVNGAIYFDDRYSLSDSWSSQFTAWKNGATIAELPEYPEENSAQAAAVAVATAAVVPVQTQTTFQPNTEAVQAVAVQNVAAAVPIAMDTVYPEVIADSAPVAPAIESEPVIFPVNMPVEQVSQAAQQSAQIVGQSAESILVPIAAALLLS